MSTVMSTPHRSQSVLVPVRPFGNTVDTMASSPRVIAVAGSTGNQGGGVVQALLPEAKAGKVKIRGLTRNANSAKAQELQALDGVDMVSADLDDRTALDKALEGVQQLFLVTDFYAHGDAAREIQQGKAAIDAAKQAGVSFIVFSTLDHLPADVKEGLPKLHDGMVIPHFESKARIEDYLRESGVPFALLRTCMFYENAINFTSYQKAADGSYMYGDNLGTAPHGWHAVADIGHSAAVVLAEPAKYKGQTIPVIGESISHPEMARVISEVTGKTVRYNQMTDEQYAALPFPPAAELSNMYAYYRKWPYYDELRPIAKRVYAGSSFKEWAALNRAELTKKLEAA